MLPEGENLFDFVDKNIVQFMLETVYIGDKKDKAITKRSFSFRLSMGVKNPLNIFGFIMLLISGFFVWEHNNQRNLAHACPDYTKVGRLIDNLKKDTNTLNKTFKKIRFNHRVIKDNK